MVKKIIERRLEQIKGIINRTFELIGIENGELKIEDLTNTRKKLEDGLKEAIRTKNEKMKMSVLCSLQLILFLLGKKEAAQELSSEAQREYPSETSAEEILSKWGDEDTKKYQMKSIKKELKALFGRLRYRKARKIKAQLTQLDFI